MEVGIFTFSKRHHRPIEKCGSSMIRGQWLLNHWPEAEFYNEGKKYDVVIFQKVWYRELYENIDAIKILDLCDPEWITDGWPIVEISKMVDAIVVSSKGLHDSLKKIIDPKDCVVVWIDDRIDLDYVGKHKKKHEGHASKVGWYGYSKNGSDSLQPTLYTLRRYGLDLLCIAENPIEFPDYDDMISNKEHAWATLPFDVLAVDFVINPPIINARAKFKSQNKTYLAWAFGLPVAHTAEEMQKYLSEDNRKKEGERVYKLVREKYDVKQSVEEYKELIDRICQMKKQSK